MPGSVRLILTLHNHQPVGNFPDILEAAYRDSYLPFLELLEQFPDIPAVIHNSGSLMEWICSAHPEYVSRLKTLVQRRQVELLGGPFFEPILSCIPRRDRVGQMIAYKRFLEQTFETTIRGMWLPERVWEQAFTSDIVAAGLQYTLLDDSHFLQAGRTEDELRGYYLTENEGDTLQVFAGCERLRYLIPFSEVHQAIDYCREVAHRSPGAVLVCGDDGEKFGSWPGTQDEVFGRGQWLRRFFEQLRHNKDWLRVTTFSETVDHVSPIGRQYLPETSYREMTEWALPTDRQREYHRYRQQLQQHNEWPNLQPFYRAANWRNFLVKYPESHEMYRRMLHVSERLQRLSADEQLRHSALHLLSGARRELYRAQCNCSYWHGAFGGLYLPHLRNAVFQHLIQADNLLEQATGRRRRWVEATVADYDGDARQEVRLASDRLIAWLSPTRGGQLYELDIRSIAVNLLATLNRRPEPYHERIREHCARIGVSSGEEERVDPQTGTKCKQPGLDQKLTYDQWPRKALIDHFLQPGATYQQFAQGTGHVGDFVHGVYQSRLRTSPHRVELRLSREGSMGPYRVDVVKTIVLSADSSSLLNVRYDLHRLPAGLPIHFGVEFNFAAMPGGAHDRFYYDEAGHSLGQLDASLQLPPRHRLGLVDEWLGIDASLDFTQPAEVWTHPIQTVSQSEGGFELVHQSCMVLPHWQFYAPADGHWSVELTLSFDTSAAQAKGLAHLPRSSHAA
jgi:4-alpha-glucanotransferase